MMASFVSKRDIDEERRILNQQRAKVLEAAKSVSVKQQQKKEDRKRRGEDQWMLKSLDKRVGSNPSKLLKKEKKHKKHKKHKKKKPSRESTSGESEASEDMWVEKKHSSQGQHEDNWKKEDFLAGIKTVTSADIREEKRKKTEEISKSLKSLSSIESAGQHEKELNPYWKSGGCGLPSEEKESSVLVPDASWLKRSLKRMQEQSKDTGRSVEEIAADRYGSWEAFQDLLSKAEKTNSSSCRGNQPKRSEKRRFLKPSDDDKQQHKPYSTSRHKSNHDSHSAWKKQDSKPSSTSYEEKTFASKVKDDVKTQTKGLKYDRNNDKSEKVVKTEMNAQVKREIKINTSSIVTPQVSNSETRLTEEEKNKIAAKIIKAELMGNDALVTKLKLKLESSKQAESVSNITPVKATSSSHKDEESSSSSSGSSDEEVVLTRTNKTGQSWPVTQSELSFDSVPKKLKKKKVKVHDKDGVRERYFADDDRFTLKELVEREKTGAAEDQTQTMSRLTSKLFKGADGEHFTLDDMFESEAGKVNSSTQEDGRNRKRAIANHQRLMRRLENCKFCFGNSENPKHLIIAIGRVCYLRLPSHRPLQPGHCLIVPMHHCNTGTSLDENVWDEIRKFMQSLRNLFLKQDSDCIFMQTCIMLNKSHHFVVECVPLPKELGDVAPIYFKKAIQECETEWSQNKKLIDTRGKSVRDKIPAGLPYFAVEFGLDGGFGHVVEDEINFPFYFGREILGGMLDAEPQLWRKPHEEYFNEQTKRTLEFEKWYKEFDWTSIEISS
ncbi:CWF19-like protein 2 [Ciona intestinalis]